MLIETHGDFADSQLMLELLVHVRHPRVGVLWDTHHPWRFHGEPVAETYARLKPWIRHTHWKDSVSKTTGTPSENAECRRSRGPVRLKPGHRSADYVLFGTGEFPAAETLRLLVDGGYDGWYSLEWEKAWHRIWPTRKSPCRRFPLGLPQPAPPEFSREACPLSPTASRTVRCSEYQYVAFRAIDAPVSEKNLSLHARQSSRAEITPWSFHNEYHYGDFRGNAKEMLRRGYDLHLHYANFGRVHS